LAAIYLHKPSPSIEGAEFAKEDAMKFMRMRAVSAITFMEKQENDVSEKPMND
jgi:hypothetical protein